MLRSFKAIVKTAGAGLMFHGGLLDKLPRPRLTVLGYHRVLDQRMPELTTSPLGMATTVEMFEHQLAFAARHYRMVTLGEIESACEGQRALPHRACFVTFDDGWEDNYRIAYPILRRMGIPAAVFVATDFVGTQKAFWFTSLMQCLLRNTPRRLQPGDGRDIGWPEDVAHELDRLASGTGPIRPWQVDRLIEMMKQYAEPTIHTMIADLAARLGAAMESTDTRYFLTWDEIREMDRGGIGFGSHTCSHRILTQLPDEEAADELRRSKQKLETELAHPIVSFAFPNGSYTPSLMKAAREAGYRAFFVSSRVRPDGDAGRLFPRPCLHDRVGQGPADRFYPSLLELHLSGLEDRLKYSLGVYK